MSRSLRGVFEREDSERGDNCSSSGRLKCTGERGSSIFLYSRVAGSNPSGEV